MNDQPPLEFQCEQCEAWFDADLVLCPACGTQVGEYVLARGGPFAVVASTLLDNYPEGVAIPISAGLKAKGNG